MHLDDAVWEWDWQQEEGGEAPGEGDQQQRPPPGHEGGVLQRVEHRDVPLQADGGQRVHAGGVDGGVAESHDVAERVRAVRVVLQEADAQVQGHDQQPERGVCGRQGEQEVSRVPRPTGHRRRDHQQHRNVSQSDHQAQSGYDAHFEGAVLQQPLGVSSWRVGVVGGWQAGRLPHCSSNQEIRGRVRWKTCQKGDVESLQRRAASGATIRHAPAAIRDGRQQSHLNISLLDDEFIAESFWEVKCHTWDYVWAANIWIISETCYHFKICLNENDGGHISHSKVKAWWPDWPSR